MRKEPMEKEYSEIEEEVKKELEVIIYRRDPNEEIEEMIEITREMHTCELCDDNGKSFTITRRACLNCNSSVMKKKNGKNIWKWITGFVFLLSLFVIAALLYYLIDNKSSRIIIFSILAGIIFLASLVICYCYRYTLKDKLCYCLKSKHYNFSAYKSYIERVTQRILE